MLRSGPGQARMAEKQFIARNGEFTGEHFDRDYTVTIPPGTKRVEVMVTSGDWLSFSQVTIALKAGRRLLFPSTVSDGGFATRRLPDWSDGSAG